MLPSSGRALNHSSCHLGLLPSNVSRVEEGKASWSLVLREGGKQPPPGSPIYAETQGCSQFQSALHNMMKTWSLQDVLRRCSPQ